jgi:hypothetical protein
MDYLHKTYVKNSIDILDVFHDNDEEQKQKRYLELIGHTDEHLFIDVWDKELCNKVKRQNIEKAQFECLTEQEISINFIESNHYMYKIDPFYNFTKVPYIKFGELCSICFEPITNRKNAYYTECEHIMHKTCITAYYNSTYNKREYGHSYNWNISCPICRTDLQKCVWLEKRGLTNPFLKNSLNSNLDYDMYKELFSEDMLECIGCECTSGCGNICGSNYDSCKSCKNWRIFTFDDLVHHYSHCSHKIKKKNFKKFRQCGGQIRQIYKYIIRVIKNLFTRE